MTIDPLQLLQSNLFKTSQRTSTDTLSPAQDFEQLLDEKSHKGLKINNNSDEEVVRLMQHAQLGLMRGLFLDDEDNDTSDGFSMVDAEHLLNRATALHSQMVDRYASVQKESEPTVGKLNERDSIDNLIDKISAHVDLAADLIHSVVRAESNYKPDAVSHVGAQGLMQLMPATAEELGVEDSFDAAQNLMGGSRYLKQLLDKYDGDLDHALAAYNWGQGNVDRQGLDNMPEETRTYIARVKGSMNS